MRIAILPTELTEWHGLGQALGRLFPNHAFYCLPTTAEVKSEPLADIVIENKMLFHPYSQGQSGMTTAQNTISE